MALPKIDPTSTQAWQQLTAHYNQIHNVSLRSLFKEDPKRATDFSIAWEGFFVDYSKNRITQQTMDLLLALANEVGLQQAITAYFGGDTINETEGRSVLHTALRAHRDDTVLVDGQNVVPEVYQVRKKR